MNKQDIFPLYVGRKYDQLFFDKSLGTQFNPLTLEIEHQTINGIHKYSDCQLILKRISDMSKKDETAYNKKRDTINSFYYEDYGGSRRDCKAMHDTIESTLWLIQNGYALSDEWFTNGIAVEAGK